MIHRALAPVLLQRTGMYPVATLTGPRQSGKTTLCRALFPRKAYLTLESPDVREHALSDPRGFLHGIRDGAVLDEIQRAPGLVSFLQEEVDRDPSPGRFILTGSENLAIDTAISQSLAGRTSVLHLLPCARAEVKAFPAPPEDLWDAVWHGGYPRVFDRRIPPPVWFSDYVATYLERDVRNLLNIGDLRAFGQFMRLAAGRTGQELNMSTLAGDVGVAVGTIRAWLSVLEASFLVALVPAWHTNARKQVVKAPKLHFLDSGLACHLLGIHGREHLALHPLRGALFESWMVSEIIKHRLNQGLPMDCWHFRATRGPEVDLMVRGASGWILVEAKSAQTVDPSFFRHLETLAGDLEPGAVAERRLVYGGSATLVRSGAYVVPWDALEDQAWG